MGIITEISIDDKIISSGDILAVLPENEDIFSVFEHEGIDSDALNIRFKDQSFSLRGAFNDHIKPVLSYWPEALMTVSGSLLVVEGARELSLKNFTSRIGKNVSETTAYHEAGHAILALLRPGIEELDHVSIIPGEEYMGYADFNDKNIKNERKSELLNEILIDLAGKVAEEIKFGEASAGICEDLENATEVAQEMVLEYGMSETLGPWRLRDSYFQKKGAPPITNELRLRIEGEIENLLKSAEQEVQKILKKNIDKLDSLAEALLEQKSMSVDEVKVVTHIYEPLAPELGAVSLAP